MFLKLGDRHAKSHNHMTIGSGNILRLWKDKGWNTVEFVETISFDSMNYMEFLDR